MRFSSPVQKRLTALDGRGFFCALLFAGAPFLAGCATLGGAFDSQVHANRLAGESHFVKESVPTGVFTLTGFTRIQEPGKPLTVYIEGDGRAWLSKNRLSDDPTPVHPMTLKLATLDDSPNVAYLARPCQYDNSVLEQPCGPEYWSDKRFSEEVIASMDEAVGFLARQANSRQIHLVGYSGGGAVAVLVAARRKDIFSIRTIAGNLDPAAVNSFHHVPPLTGSLTPLSEAKTISSIPQTHFVGSRDKVVPPVAAENFLKASGSPCARIVPVDGATHHAGWTERWKELLKIPVDSC